MRRTRRIFLLAIVVIVGVIGSVYYKKKIAEAKSRPQPPPPMLGDSTYSAKDWVYFKGDGDIPKVEVRAQDMQRVEHPEPRLQLKGVRLKLFHKDGKSYDFVECATADFDETKATMFSDGDVKITLAVPDDPEQIGRLLKIESSGVVVEANTGKARTDRLTKFAYDLGDGQAMGAFYDPETRELQLVSDVVLNWRGSKPGQKPMRIEAGHLVHNENESKVYLSPWSKLFREELVLEAAASVITIDHGNIRLVESSNATGVDKLPNRQLTFGADQLTMNLTEKSEVEKIQGVGHSRLEVTSDSAKTNVTTETIDLQFAIQDKNSILQTALATGKSVVESKPVAKAGTPPGATRILKADAILTKMRPGGEEVEAMETHTPGTLDLLPNAPDQPRRHITADRMWIAYAAKNQIETFRAVKVTTDTRKPKGKAKTDPPPALTWSNDLLAKFDPAKNEMTSLEQWNSFRYEEGERHATSEHAVLDAAKNQITLSKPARAWDPTGSVNADQIVMNQETGDFTATGNVASTRVPDKKTTTSNAMLTQDEPIQAKAQRMVSTERNQKVLYEGKAVLWQTANRLEADRVLINRKEQTLNADGNVVSQFLDKKMDPKTKKQPHTLVRATKLVYSDKDRVALYSGPVRMIREGMDVKSKELRAWLNESKKDPKDPKDPKDAKDSSDSTLNRAFADGNVEIFQVDEVRTRKGNSEHAEFYVADDKVVMNGGIAQMVDSIKGLTRGKQLTYFSRNDTLQVEGAITQPVVSKIRRN